MKSPILSIIVPMYNAQPYLRACMNSIIAQNKFPEFEVIIVNDGSTDMGPDIIYDEYMSKYPNIHMHTQENAGVSVARNTGMAMANGEYISFVDPDDAIGASYELCADKTYIMELLRIENLVYKEGFCPENVERLIAQRYDPDYFMRMIKAAQERDADIVLANQIMLDYTGSSPVMCITEYRTNRTFDTSAKSKEILLRHSFMRKSANFALYRRDLIQDKKLEFPVGMHLDEDMLFCDLALMRANTVATAIKSSYLYKRHNGTLSTGRTKYEQDLAFVRRQLVVMNDIIDKPEYQQIFLTQIRQFKSWYSSTGCKDLRKLLPYRHCTQCKKDTCDACDKFEKLKRKIRKNIQKTLPQWNFQR